MGSASWQWPWPFTRRYGLLCMNTILERNWKIKSLKHHYMRPHIYFRWLIGFRTYMFLLYLLTLIKYMKSRRLDKYIDNPTQHLDLYIWIITLQLYWFTLPISVALCFVNWQWVQVLLVFPLNRLIGGHSGFSTFRRLFFTFPDTGLLIIRSYFDHLTAPHLFDDALLFLMFVTQDFALSSCKWYQLFDSCAV